MARDYSFQDQLGLSHGIAGDRTVEAILLAHIPNAVSVEVSAVSDDKQGTDYWVYRNNAKPLSVDLKARNDDPMVSFGKDDLALETWSVKGRKIGWTLDASRGTDYILWLFRPTKRWALVPFPMLCAVFTEHRDEWVARYSSPTQSSNNRSWESECVFVPRREIWAAIYRHFGGNGSH